MHRRRFPPAGLLALAAAAALSPAAAIAQGYVADPPARLAAVRKMPRHRAYLPAAVDLSAALPRPGWQGAAGSCAGWAVAYALGSYYAGSAREAPLSPAYVFNQIALTPGRCRPGGASLVSALEVLQRQGSVPLSAFPYNPDDCTRLPDAGQQAVAQRHRIGAFARLDTSRLDDVKGALALHRPVAFGMWIDYARLQRLGAGEVYDIPRVRGGIGHAMVLAGYDDARGAFRVLNSWGTDWADGGYGWISYAAFQAGSDAAFSVTDPPGPAAPATESPLPADTPGPAPAEPAQVPPESAPRWDAAMQALADDFVCAHVVVDAATRRVSGHVSLPADLDRLRAMLPAGTGFDVALRPWPQCEALETLARVPHDGHGLAVETVDHPQGRYRQGEQMVLRIRMPDVPAHLHLAYVDAAGDAVVAWPRPGASPPPQPAGSVLVLGRDPPDQYWIDGPRFGNELLVAVATAEPLAIDPADGTERAYLTALRRALLATGHVVDALAVPLSTRAADTP
jgi:hypothetical protein